MKQILKLLLIIITFGAIQPAYAVTVLPPGIKEYDFLYDQIERYETLSFERFDFQLTPYRNIKDNFESFPFLKNIDNDKLAYFVFISEDFRSSKYSRPVFNEAGRLGFTNQPFKNGFIYAGCTLDETKARDPYYTGKKWRGLAGTTEEAFFYYHTDKFDLTLGRFASSWGNRKSMVLGNQNRMDGLAYTFRVGKISLSYRLAKLNQTVDSLSYLNRYLAAHRLDLHITANLRLGFFEAIVFGGVGRQIELNYLNPIIFFHGDQLNDRTNDNSFIGFDFTYKPKYKIKFYGQILIDDFQIEKNNAGDNEPNQYALNIGAFFVKIYDDIDIKAEYTRVANWTFNQMFEHNRYLFNNSPIADVDKNDYDELSCKINKWFNSDKSAGFLISYRRSGESEITDNWSAPWLTDSDYSERFPGGTIEKRFNISANVEGFFLNRFFVNMKAGLEKYEDYQHIKDNDQTIPYINIYLSSFLSGKFSIK